MFFKSCKGHTLVMSILTAMKNPTVASRMFQSFLIGRERVELYGSYSHLYMNCLLLSGVVDGKEEEKGPIHFLSEQSGVVDKSFMAVWYLINGYGNDPEIKKMRDDLSDKAKLKMWTTFNYFHVDQRSKMIVEWYDTVDLILRKTDDEKCYDLIADIAVMSRKGSLNPYTLINSLRRLVGDRGNVILPRYLKKEGRTCYISSSTDAPDLGSPEKPENYIFSKRYSIYFRSFQDIHAFFLTMGEDGKEFVTECSEMFAISPAKVNYLMEESKLPQQYVTITKEDGIVYSLTPEDEKATQCTLRRMSSRSTLDLLIAMVMSPHGPILDGDDLDHRSYFTIITRSVVEVQIRDIQYLVTRIRGAIEETKDPYEVLKRCSEYTPMSDQILPRSDSSLIRQFVEEGKCVEIYGLRYDGYGIVTLPFKNPSPQRVHGCVSDVILYYMIRGELEERATSGMGALGHALHAPKVRMVREAYEKYLNSKK